MKNWLDIKYVLDYLKLPYSIIKDGYAKRGVRSAGFHYYVDWSDQYFCVNDPPTETLLASIIWVLNE